MYDRKDENIAVLTPKKNAVEYKKNYYTLPAGKVTDEDRVRVEKHGKILLIYHALTNDLICKHIIPEGEGNTVTLPKIEKMISIEQELKLDYKEYPAAQEFLKRMRKRAPRYVYPQCRRIHRLRRYYTEDQIVDGFQFCVNEDICSVKELCAYFMYRYGEDKAKVYIAQQTFRHYKERANEIRGEMLNGNNN